jgi:hypothetical protein
MSKSSPSPHRWSFYRAGGVDQVRLATGADLLHLDELDQKLWIALSCPTKGLELDPRTLELLDEDGDGHVRPPELVAAVRWLRTVLRDPEVLIGKRESLPLAAIRTDTDAGKALLASANHMLKSLGRQGDEITVADTKATAEALRAAERNGDGVVQPDSIADATTRKAAEEIVACMGGVEDRSGKLGYDQARLDGFFAACAAYDAWYQIGEKDQENLLPFGADTNKAFAAFVAVRAKVDDWFARCRLLTYDERAKGAVHGDEAAFKAAAAGTLTLAAEPFAGFPLATVAAGAALPLVEGVNPAWAEPVAALRAHCFAGKQTITEADWTALAAKLAPHEAWRAGRTGAEVEALGIERVRALLQGKVEEQLAAEIAADLAVAPEVDAMRGVEKLAHFARDLHTLAENYVSFTDFYARRGAIFQAGTLHLDGRTTEMCFHVQDAGRHTKMAPMANAYLVYVKCTRGKESMEVACALTAGDCDNVFEGRNGIFYDRKGNDWDATITRIVVNPISVRQAFASPYKRVLRGIQEAVAKRAAAADEAATGKLAAGASAAGEAAKTGNAPPKPKFDVGTIAALGVAVAGITGVFTALLTGFLSLGPWLPIGLVALMLAISGPSMFIAWLKLRTRNLGPILDANGWAVNTLTRVNVPLGRTLTALPEIPKSAHRSLVDPYAPKRSIWPRLVLVLLLLGGTGYVLYRTNVLHGWLPDYVPLHHKETALAIDGGKDSVEQGAALVLTVRSGARTLQVTDVGGAAPTPQQDLLVTDGKATLQVAADQPPTTLRITDAVSETSVTVTVQPK